MLSFGMMVLSLSLFMSLGLGMVRGIGLVRQDRWNMLGLILLSYCGASRGFSLLLLASGASSNGHDGTTNGTNQECMTIKVNKVGLWRCIAKKERKEMGDDFNPDKRRFTSVGGE